MKKKTKTEPTLKSMTALYKKRGFKRPAAHAKQYMLGYTALHNKEHFTPTEDADVWKQESARYFQGGYWRTDDFASICAEAIQTLTMC